MFVLLLLGVVAIGYLYHFVKNREMYALSRQLPGPLALPFIGNAYNFIGVTNEGILSVLDYLTTSFPTPLRYWLGPKFFLLVTKPADVQAVLTSQHCLNRDDVYDFTRTYAGDGLIALKSECYFEWQRTRHKLTHAKPCFQIRPGANIANF